MDLDEWIWVIESRTRDLDRFDQWIWINGSGTMDLDQWIWINKVSTTSNYMVERQLSDWCKSAKCQKKTNLEYLAVQLTVASLIALLALSKDVRQASFPRDDVPQNGAHRFWGLEKRKRNMLKKFHLPITNRA